VESADKSIRYFLTKIEDGFYTVQGSELYDPKGKKLGTIHRNGYKVYAYNLYRVYAHRLLFAYYHGIDELYKYESINHINRNKLDNRAGNLEGCSLSDNTKHQWTIDNHILRGDTHPNAKLTEKDVIMIKQILASGDKRLSEISSEFNVTPGTIYKIKKGISWKHVH